MPCQGTAVPTNNRERPRSIPVPRRQPKKNHRVFRSRLPPFNPRRGLAGELLAFWAVVVIFVDLVVLTVQNYHELGGHVCTFYICKHGQASRGSRSILNHNLQTMTARRR